MASKWAIQTFSPISRSYPKFPLTAICSNYIDDEHKVSFQNNNFCYINVNYDPKFHVFIFIPLFVSKIFAILSSYIQSLNDSRPFAHCPKFQHHSINHFTDSDLRLTRPSRPSERCLMNSNLLSLNHFLSRSFFPSRFFSLALSASPPPSITRSTLAHDQRSSKQTSDVDVERLFRARSRFLT